ncbi:MAG TPA: hypothetical protein VHM70_22170 [Polyangiaceae bacterium]|nr:hypothetical protein [Polyangiaceae bacterium]
MKFARGSFAHASLGAALALTSSGAAHADDELEPLTGKDQTQQEPASDHGPELAARVGYASAFGRIERGERIRQTLAGAVPFWVDLGYRLDSHWFVGVFGHYGLGIASATSKSDCSGCNHSWLRFGLQAQHRWLLGPRRAIWLGLGLGREYLNTSIDQHAQHSRSISGWEWLNAQFGCDFQPAEGFGVGPFLGFSLGTYTTGRERCLDETLCPRLERDVTKDLEAPGIHGWVNAGVRFVLFP